MAELSRRTLQSLVGADLLVGRAGEGSGLLLGGGRLGSLTCLENESQPSYDDRHWLDGASKLRTANKRGGEGASDDGGDGGAAGRGDGGALQEHCDG